MSETDTADGTVNCPADGCPYAGPRGSVVAHYSGKPDDDHPGGYSEAQSRVPGEGDDSGGSAGDDAGGPGGKLSFPVADGSDPDGCPDCGEDDWYDADDVLDAGDYTGEQAELLRQSDRVCPNCGEVYDA